MVRTNQPLTIQKIAEEGKFISKKNQFMGSHGWAKNFLKRYPEMRQLYDKSKFMSRQETTTSAASKK
jgi:hypothetical protein